MREQGDCYNTVCLLYFDYNKNHYRLTTVDLSRQEKLDANAKAIKQAEFLDK